MVRLAYVLVAVLAVVVAGIVYVLESEAQNSSRFTHVPITKRNVTERTVLKDHYTRTVYTFDVEGTTVEGWLYLPHPAPVDPPALILMAHGLAAQKDFGLEEFAKQFVIKGGYGAFIFDYRNFGGSDGLPRNWVDPSRHVTDWLAALDFVIGSPELNKIIDTTMIGLWGSSFSGGHVLVTAATTLHKERIRAVVSQVSYLDPMATFGSLDPINTLKLVTLAIADLVTDVLGLSPIYIRCIGQPNEFAVLNTPDSHLYLNLLPKEPLGGWQNKILARAGISTLSYKPIDYADKVTAPVLVVAGTGDVICPFSAVTETMKKLPNGKLLSFAGGHFDIYSGPVFDKYAAEEVQFFKTHLA